MKNQIFQTVMCFMVMASIVSCSKEHQINEKRTVSQKDDPLLYIKELEREILSSGKEYRIEAATLEELNAALRANGLDEISPEEVEKAKTRVHPRTTWACATWVALGDWDGNSTLNVSDLVAARNWLCDYGVGGCYGDATSIYSCSPCPPSQGTNFAWLSGLGYDTNWNLLGDSDIDAGTDRILTLIPCY